MASQKKGSKKILLILAVPVFILVLVVLFQQYKKIQLISFYNRLIGDEKTQNWKDEYNLLSPEQRLKTSLNDYVQSNSRSQNPVSTQFIVYSYKVNGDVGIVDRTRIDCYSADCTGTNRQELRVKKQYIYINGHWYMPDGDNTIYCDRSEPYSIPPEFTRALSLIIQRLENGQTVLQNHQEAKDKSAIIKKISSCLDIQYAQSDSDLSGAEGVFLFDKNSSPDDLKILVSNKYEAKDDLLTATLLIHEVTHALYHADGDDKNMSCFTNEANAYTSEIAFYNMLNQEERDSIYARYNTSPEAKSLIDWVNYAFGPALKVGKPTMAEDLLPYIESQPFYQNECK